jgi:hypothetical protein
MLPHYPYHLAQKGLEALGTQAITGFPHLTQCIDYLIPIAPPATSSLPLFLGVISVQQTDRCLAVIARHLDKLIQCPSLLLPL